MILTNKNLMTQRDRVSSVGENNKNTVLRKGSKNIKVTGLHL